MASLAEWRDSLLGGAHMDLTNFEANHADHVFKHYQFTGVLPKGQADDHHSPVRPAKRTYDDEPQYIELRIEPALDFYRKRIPENTRRVIVLRLLLIALSAATSVLSVMGQLNWITAVTGLASAVTSWSEFSDANAKVERYTSTVNGLKKLLIWWNHLNDLQKLSRDNLVNLIRTAETILIEEQLSWTSMGTGKRPTDGASEGGRDEEGAGMGAEPSSPASGRNKFAERSGGGGVQMSSHL